MRVWPATEKNLLMSMRNSLRQEGHTLALPGACRRKRPISSARAFDDSCLSNTPSVETAVTSSMSAERFGASAG